MTEELTLTVTDLERKAIVFCREKDISFPIANYLVDFATEVTKELEQKLEQTEKDLADYQFNYPTIKELEKENADLKEQIQKMKCCQNCEIFTYHNSASCCEPILIYKSHGTYICDKWKLREKWDDR